MNSRVVGLLMFLAGVGLLVYGVVMKFFINDPLARMTSPPARDMFLRPPPVKTGMPDWVPIVAGAIVAALGLLLRLGK